MARIALEGMHFYAYHGFYEEERIIGNHYLVDIVVNVNTAKAAAIDDIGSTVNYETIYQICRFEMKKSTQLLETLAQRIAQRIQNQFNGLSGGLVRISKKNPPLGGKVEHAFVEVNWGR